MATRIGKQGAGQQSATAERAGRAEAAGGELDRGIDALSQIVQRIARDGCPASGDLRDAAFALQRLAGNQSTARRLSERAGGGARRSVREVALSGFQGGGHRLPHVSRIQASFGAHDLSGVRSFTGPGAAAASRALSAEAYASGDRVVFADSAPTLHTVAHEAAHVIQQRAGIRLPGGIGNVGDPHERHADAVADKVVRGESAERSLDTYFSARPSPPAGGGAMGVQRKLAGALLADVDTEQDAAKQTAARYAAIIDKLEMVLEEKEGLKINPDAVLAAMIYRLENFDGDFEYSTYEHLIDALTTRGAILVDGKESGKPEEKARKKIAINILLPGSGDRRWRTFAENMLGDGVATRKEMFEGMEEIGKDDKVRKELGIASGWKVFPTLYKDSDTFASGDTYMIRGPGTSDRVSTHPSNTIEKNLATATAIVEHHVETFKEERVKVRIMGHSRNGVVATLLTRNLRGKYPKLEIDAVIFDPVPGGDASAFGGYKEAALPSDEKADQDVNSTVIYSLTDTRLGFNPLHVYGAKRLILTHYSHHAGIEPGFRYEGKHLKGLGLLDLPAGIFVDEKQTPGKPNLLVGPFDDLAAIEPILTSAQEDKDDGNKNRIARILAVVKEFLKSRPKGAVDDVL